MKLKHIIGTTLMFGGLTVCIWFTGEPKESVSIGQMFIEALVGLVSCFIGVLMLADVEVEAPDDEDWEQEKSRR